MVHCHPQLGRTLVYSTRDSVFRINLNLQTFPSACPIRVIIVSLAHEAQAKQQNHRRVLAILDANAGNLSETARVLKLPKSTLKGWRDTKASDDLIARYRTVKNEQLAEGFRAISALALERLIAEQY